MKSNIYLSGYELLKLFKTEELESLPDSKLMFPWLHDYTHSNPPETSKFKLSIIRSQPLNKKLFLENSGLLKNSIDVHELFMPCDPIIYDVKKIISDELKEFSKLTNHRFTNDDIGRLFEACSHFQVFPFILTDTLKQIKYGKGYLTPNLKFGELFNEKSWKRLRSSRRFDLQSCKQLELSNIIVVYCLETSTHLKNCPCHEVVDLINWAKLFVSLNYHNFNPLWCCKILNEIQRLPTELISTIPIDFCSVMKINNKQLTSKFDIISLNNWERNLLYREKLEISKMSGCTMIDVKLFCGNTTDLKIYQSKRYSTGISTCGSEKKYYSPKNTIVKLETLMFNDENDLLKLDEEIFNLPTNDYEFGIFIHCVENASFPDMVSIENSLKSLNPIQTFQFPSSGSISLGNLTLDSIKIIINICHLIHQFGLKTKYSSFLYCSDGYTETSCLLVAYLIFLWDLPLEKVIFKLHLELERPFFLFPVDLQMLGHLQILLRELSPKRFSERNNEPLLIESEMFSKIFFTKLPSDSFFIRLKGPLPSRILPHLYLGSLEHAQSLDLLRTLGIKNIVSVGENVSWVSNIKLPSSKINIVTSDQFRVCFINNLNDNGTDPILSHLDDILNFIDDCYVKNEKVLVHCMVGVSRSATVCIAECMKRLQCSVISAYLFVRVRRLNIIIQPNLMFMYELLKWQELTFPHQKKITWHTMCRAISELNSHYI